jgi:hypothetical protein
MTDTNDAVEGGNTKLREDLLLMQQISVRIGMNYVPVNLADMETVLAALSDTNTSEGVPDTTHNAELVGELQQEADLCRNEGADDIAVLLDKAIAALRTPDSDLLREKLVDAFVLLPLEGDAGCDKLTEYEWEMVAEVAVQLLCSRLSPAQKGGA